MARTRKEEMPVDIMVPITPMLDMSFQLLSFFILTFHPMPVEGQLSVSLPKIESQMRRKLSKFARSARK